MKRLKKLLAAVICTAMTISMCACSGTTPPDPTPSDSGTQLPEGSTFSITYFDVGQADAALVECDGQYMLIDGGNKSDSQKMYAILKEKNIGNLFYIVATDVSDEHIGGLAGALNYATADITFCAVENHSSKAFSDLKKYADKNSSGIREPSVGNKYALSSAEIEFLAVSDSSIILKITYGETVFIFAGDVDAEFEKTIISSGTDIDATVLKVASHGSENATSTAFLRETKPEYAVISSAGSEGYPSEDVLSLMEIASVNLYRTDLHGDIICTSDGKNVSFTTEKQPTRAEDIFKPGKAATIKNEEQKNEPEQTQNPVATTTPTPTPTTTPASSDKPGRQPELESPFSVDELYEANLMTVITANHHTAQTESYFMGTTYYDGTFLVDDRIAKLNTYIYDSGTANYSGWYNGYTFYVNHMERPVQTVYVEAFDGDQYYPYQMDLATYFMNHDEVEFKGKKGNDYLYQINTYPSEYTVTVDGKTKVIKEIEFGGEKVVYTYGQRVPGQDLLDAWYGNLKGIYVSVDIYDGSEHQHLERMFYIPYNWELEISSLGSGVNVYMDRNYTVPYTYPGDGVSCELYVTNSVG